MVGYEDFAVGAEELSLVYSCPLVLELNRLQNQLKEKDRELSAAQAEIKALKATEVLKDKAVEELQNEVKKLDEKHRLVENLLEQKNLDIKRLNDEKKDALAAQYAAEATLRRVHANQRDDDPVPIESVIAPLEAEIKMYRNEIAVLREDRKAMERLNKSKESALLEAERILRSALERALIVEEVQNQNFELKKQIEIYQEENRILEKTNRQKVLEVEKLSETIQELEEAILAGGVAANAIRDYRRQISELNDEKRTLERELARVKVSANRVATVVANEWKDENDKVMPVKQWLEERRLLQSEMQRLKDKLAISERTTKAEAQLKDKMKLRLKTLEEGLKHTSNFSINPNAVSGSPKVEKSNSILGFFTSPSGQRKRSTSQPRASSIRRGYPLQQPNMENETAHVAGDLGLQKKYATGENMPMRKNMWVARNKVVDGSGKENAELKTNTDANVGKDVDTDTRVSAEIKNRSSTNEESQIMGNANSNPEDVISVFLYDRLQKEVINLRKACEAKESSLSVKDEEIKMLMKKVDALTKAIEIDSKRMKREVAARDKETGSTKVNNYQRTRDPSSKSRAQKSS